MSVRHKFIGPNGIEVNELEFARLLASGKGPPLVIRASKKRKKKSGSRRMKGVGGRRR